MLQNYRPSKERPPSLDVLSLLPRIAESNVQLGAANAHATCRIIVQSCSPLPRKVRQRESFHVCVRAPGSHIAECEYETSAACKLGRRCRP